MVPTVIFTAAHGGFDLRRVPLGGAAAISAFLMEEWRKQKSFKVHLLEPGMLGERAPKDKDLVRYSELRYARFCFDFEKAATSEILRHDPRDVVVLSNDVSEGPAFRHLAHRGYRLYTIYHVDVVDYVTRLYLRGWVRPETLTRAHGFFDATPLRRFLPGLLKLIFGKQRDSVLYSHGLIVPSEGMKQTLLRCYPESPAERIHVLPWGSRAEKMDSADVDRRAKALRKDYGIPVEARVLLTLSRISPEKGQDRLLKALALWEREGSLPEEGVWVLICGEAAYMKGARFRKRLEVLARKLNKVHVVFPGYLAGVDKQAHFRLADLYVFPSRHESYGLTLLEACRAGLPVLASRHYGAEELVRPEFGELMPDALEADVPVQLKQSLQRLLADRKRLKKMGEQAKVFAEQKKFSDTARQLAGILTG